jgi:hypothetical protein
VRPDQVLRPVGDMTGVAVLRVGGMTGHPDAVSLDFQSPAVGGVFVIAAARDGARVDVPERVQFLATRLVVGDRSLAALPGCIGAPALSEKGVFGVVIDCAPGRAPVVALLSAARAFLSRHLMPAPQTSIAGETPRFTLSQRLLDGPLMTVGCDAVNAGEVVVPYQLRENEKAVDATASFLNAN